MISGKAVRTSIYTALNVSSVTGDLGAGSASIVHAVAPPNSGARYPIVVFNLQADTSSLAFGANAFDSQVWLVKAVTNSTSASAAEDIDKACRDVLDFKNLTITGGTALSCTRESGVSYTETDGDHTFRHHGSIYRIVVA